MVGKKPFQEQVYVWPNTSSYGLSKKEVVVRKSEVEGEEGEDDRS